MTKGRKKDLQTIEYFGNLTGDTNWSNVHNYDCFIKDIIDDPNGDSADQLFFEHADSGIPFSGRRCNDINRLKFLLCGVSWREIMMNEYERGIYDIPYVCLLGIYPTDTLLPRCVVDFMKTNMFKGQDAERIETIYQYVIENKEAMKEQLKPLLDKIGIDLDKEPFIWYNRP